MTLGGIDDHSADQVAYVDKDFRDDEALPEVVPGLISDGKI